MALHPSIDDSIKDTIETMLGLPSLHQSLDTRLQTYEDALSRLSHEYSFLHSQLCDKDELISRAKEEAAMNAQGIRKFVEANRNLAAECADLQAQRNKLETECSLYDQDREALMDFANEVEERARDAKARVHELEGEVQRLSGELQLQKHNQENERDDDLVKDRMVEEELLEYVVTSLIDKGEAASAYSFLEAHSSQGPCKELHQMWDILKPSTQKVLALAAKLKKLEKDKKLCRINLRKAEDEVKLFCKENGAFLERNKRLLLHYQRERSLSRSKSEASTRSIKRKPTNNDANTTPVKSIDFTDADSPRHPLSPLKQNSPDIRMLTT